MRLLSLHAIGLLALASCSVSTADVSKDTSKDLTVDLAAVTLADECAPPTPPKPASTVPATPAKTPPPGSPMPADQAPGKGGYRSNCNQTSMQLMIKSPTATTVKIKKVELLDDKGKLLEVLTSRVSRTWADSKYTTWDEKLVAGQTVQAMYDLTTPDWNKLTGGRMNAHTKAFQVRVTVTIGGTTKTVEKQAITAVRLPPPVPT